MISDQSNTEVECPCCDMPVDPPSTKFPVPPPMDPLVGSPPPARDKVLRMTPHQDVVIKKGETLYVDTATGEATVKVGDAEKAPGFPPADSEGRDRTPEMLAMAHEAQRFYMELHRWKGSWDYNKAELVEYITRNFNDLIDAIVTDDKREILAEGCGVNNHVNMAMYLLAYDELKEIQDWVPKLDELKGIGGSVPRA